MLNLCETLKSRVYPTLTGLALYFQLAPVLANPSGMTVVNGSATVVQQGPNLTVQVSHNATLDWRQFNIPPGETTTFAQPSSRSVVWNRILDQNPSQILGSLHANGNVVLYNQHGFYFGADSVIKVGGLVATTVPPAPEGGGGGALWQFNGTPPVASIVNYGQIETAGGGAVYLIAEKVKNNGVIMAPDGTIGLYAGKEVLLSERPDGRGLSARVRLPAGSVDNQGKLVAQAGKILLHAAAVNQNGTLMANSVRERGGVIELVAEDSVVLLEKSLLQASGGAGSGVGGRIEIKSNHTFADAPGSRVEVMGGDTGGQGGEVALSAPHMAAIHSRIEGQGVAGFKGGTLWIDPTDIVLGQGATAPQGDGSALYLDVDSSFYGLSRITLQADRDITLAGGTTWNLNQSTGVSEAGSLLRLEAGRNLVFQDNSRLEAGQGWSMQLLAGYNPAAGKVLAGRGGIYLNGGLPDADGNRPGGTGSVLAQEGSIFMQAGQDIVVGSGFIRTEGGGSIQLQTLAGDVDAGTKRDGYEFTRRGYTVSSQGLGGIATAAGGDVTIEAGRDLASFIPASGAYGSGNVTLKAGRNIFGKFLVRDGQGRLSAGNDIGSEASTVTLSLIQGSWGAQAGHDLFLNEVLNPNGTFNPSRLNTGARVAYQFDYAADAAVKLQAGHSVQLLGNALERTPENQNLLPVYPPILDIIAGAGGVVMGNDVVLAPSALAQLHVTTTQGGGWRSTANNSFQMVLSDSGSAEYKNFVKDHARVPLQLSRAQDPIELNISGTLANVRLQLPKQARINVGGDTLNFFFTGQNLHAGEETRLTVAGDIRNRSDITSVILSRLPNLLILDPRLSTQPGLGLASKLGYDPKTHRLTFQGKMSAAERDYLLHPILKVTDDQGQFVLNTRGEVVTAPAAPLADPQQVLALYLNSQDVPSFPVKNGGFLVGGPGTFTVTAHNMDLGITAGIRSVLTGLNPSLARPPEGHTGPYHGADVKVTLLGNLDMISSQIASFNGGNIVVNAGGAMNIGSQDKFTSDDTPKGIYSGNGGAVTVRAQEDIQVNGSRIGTYDGGNVSVTSVGGSVDAGSGGAGFFSITTSQLNPLTDQIELRNDLFFGSGIVALTRKTSDAPVGSIQVEAGRDILANAGGVLQLAFNKADVSQSKVSLEARGDIRAGQSGVLGVNVQLKAGGSVDGLVVSQRDIVIDAVKSVSVTALASGGVSVSSGGSVSGSLVGGGNVSVAGDSISASVVSTGGATSTSGDASAAKVGAFQNNAAPTTAPQTTEAETAVAAAKPKTDQDDVLKKKPGKGPVLAKSTGRVTVILPRN